MRRVDDSPRSIFWPRDAADTAPGGSARHIAHAFDSTGAAGRARDRPRTRAYGDVVVKRPQVIAHRGSSARHPDNSWAAFEAALVDGADAIECDVQATR